jgi:surface polysaccharide O-acyltransferase-like enzyme
MKDLQKLSPTPPENKRTLIHLEFLRIIGCYLVMFNHTGNHGYFKFSNARESGLYWVYMFMSVGCKAAVPIFFMISGALLLGKEESIKDIFIRRVFKFVKILIVVSVLYQVYDWKYNNTAFTLANCLKTIYSDNASAALWYLYSYIGVLMMLPFLRKMARLMETGDYLYLAAGYVCMVGIIPVIQYYLSGGTLSLNESFSPVLFTVSNIFFCVMGYFVENVLHNKYFNRKNALALVALSVLCIILSCMMTQYKADLTGELSETFFSSLISIPTFTLYYCVKMLFMKVKIDTRILKGIQFAGSTTFGIYLLERILRERLLFVFDCLEPVIHTMPACLLYILICMMIGTVIVAVLKRIPLIRRYI